MNGQPGRGALLLCVMLFLGTVINYMDRQILGLLKGDLSRDLGWDEFDYAHVVMAFQAAYAVGYAVCGRLVDAFGAGLVLPWAAGIWSLATGLHACCAATWHVMGSRVVLGIAEGANFPAAIRLVGEAFSPARRAIAIAAVTSGSGVGAILCPFLAVALSQLLGWRGAFLVLGLLGFAWVAAWWVARMRMPLGAARSGGSTIGSGGAVRWRTLLVLRGTWAYLAACILAGPVWWFYLFWIPDFLQRKFGVTLDAVTAPIAAIYVCSMAGGIGGGWLSGRFIERGMPSVRARKTALLACAIAVVPVSLAANVDGMWMTVAVVGLAAAAHQGWSANLHSLTVDIMPAGSVSSLVGIGGFLCSLASLGMAQAVAMAITMTGGYQVLFWWAASSYLLSFIILHLLVRSRSHAL